jgi:hypothetical protein
MALKRSPHSGSAKGQEWAHFAPSKLQLAQATLGQKWKEKQNREKWPNSILLSPHPRRSNTKANPNTPPAPPSPGLWIASPHGAFCSSGFSAWVSATRTAPPLSKGDLFVCLFVSSSALKSGCLLPCDLNFSLAEKVFWEWEAQGRKRVSSLWNHTENTSQTKRTVPLKCFSQQSQVIRGEHRTQRKAMETMSFPLSPA